MTKKRKKVHAENKGEFFERLQKSKSWYYDKFDEYQDVTGFSKNMEKSEVTKQVHAERKVNQFVEELNRIKKRKKEEI